MAACLVVLSLVVAGCADKPSGGTKSPPATSSSATRPDSALWPFVSGGTRYDDPVEAARSFAVDYLGFVDPVVGSFMEGDSRSGEVAIKANSPGPETTVLLRKLASEKGWWVIGASTANLLPKSPAAMASISSPVTLLGQSTAFEATVNVQIRQDGTLAPLKEDIVMGGSNGEMGPFSNSVAFPTPTARAGAVVLKTMSAKDGNIWEASVVRVTFAP